MLDAIQYSYADILDVLRRVPNWLTSSALVIGGIMMALIANTVIVHTLRGICAARCGKNSLLTCKKNIPARCRDHVRTSFPPNGITPNCRRTHW